MDNKSKTILDKYSDFQACIGIEVHVQLKTNSKIFCSCHNRFGDKPNKNICPICAGYPGTLPVLNRKVVDFAIMAGIATNCDVKKVSKFARKHYMYPDLPKNFQITQGSFPICSKGHVKIQLEDGSEKEIGLTRIHIEEDAGKAIHANDKESFVDLNRAGTPLLEIVSEPDISDSVQAREYLKNLRNIVRYLGISDADMEKGSFRGDINISVKKKSDSKLGTKVELKNINSFKFIVQAIEYEIERQIELVKSGERVKQETRLWDTKNQVSVFMRSKEEAMDYRYLREPDLPLIVVGQKWLEDIKKQIPELPYDKFKRFQEDYKLSSYESEILINDIDLANFFESVVKNCNEPKIACNWMLRNLLAHLKDNKLNLNDSKVTAENFAELVCAIADDVINSKVAQDVFDEMAKTGNSPKNIIKEKGLEQVGSSEELEKIVLEIIKNNPDQVKAYLGGKDRLFGFFVGLAMKETKGKGNPKIIQDLFKKNLK